MLPQKVEDFPRHGVSPEFRFLENGRTIDNDLEAAAARRLHGDFNAGIRVPERGGQTGSPWFVVSNDTVFDRRNHEVAVSVGVR